MNIITLVSLGNSTRFLVKKKYVFRIHFLAVKLLRMVKAFNVGNVNLGQNTT